MSEITAEGGGSSKALPAAAAAAAVAATPPPPEPEVSGSTAKKMLSQGRIREGSPMLDAQLGQLMGSVLQEVRLRAGRCGCYWGI